MALLALPRLQIQFARKYFSHVVTKSTASLFIRFSTLNPRHLSLSLLFLSLLPQVLRVSDNLNEQIEKCCKFLLARYEKSFIICAGAAELNPQKMSIIGVDLLSLRAHLKIFTMTLRDLRWRGGVYGFGLPKIQLCNCV